MSNVVSVRLHSERMNEQIHVDPHHAAIRLRGFVKRFGAITAVDGLDLEVGYGACVGFSLSLCSLSISRRRASYSSRLRTRNCRVRFALARTPSGVRR